MGAWLGKLQCRVTGSEASQETEKSHIFWEGNFPRFAAWRSTRLWDMSRLSHTWHLKTGLWMIQRQQAKGTAQSLPQALMLKVKPCTSVLGFPALSVIKLCLGETPMGQGTPSPPCLACLLWGCCTCHTRGGNFRSGVHYPSAIASVGTHQGKRDT